MDLRNDAVLRAAKAGANILHSWDEIAGECDPEEVWDAMDTDEQNKWRCIVRVVHRVILTEIAREVRKKESADRLRQERLAEEAAKKAAENPCDVAMRMLLAASRPIPNKRRRTQCATKKQATTPIETN